MRSTVAILQKIFGRNKCSVRPFSSCSLRLSQPDNKEQDNEVDSSSRERRDSVLKRLRDPKHREIFNSGFIMGYDCGKIAGYEHGHHEGYIIAKIEPKTLNSSPKVRIQQETEIPKLK